MLQLLLNELMTSPTGQQQSWTALSWNFAAFSSSKTWWTQSNLDSLFGFWHILEGKYNTSWIRVSIYCWIKLEIFHVIQMTILNFIFQLVQRHDSHYYVMDRPLHYPKGTLCDFNDWKRFYKDYTQFKRPTNGTNALTLNYFRFTLITRLKLTLYWTK